MKIPNLKAITAEERQRDSLIEVMIEQKNQIYVRISRGTLFIFVFFFAVIIVFYRVIVCDL